MDLLKNIIHYFKNDMVKDDPVTQSRAFPVFWGFPHYDDKIRAWLKDNQIDADNHQDSYMLIQEYVKTTIDGIQLVKPQVQNYPAYGFEAQESESNHNQSREL